MPGRINTTIYMYPDTIKKLKIAALEEARNAYEIVDEAVLDWLAKKKPTKSKA